MSELSIERANALSDLEIDALGLNDDPFGVADLPMEWKRKTQHYLVRSKGLPICRVGTVGPIDVTVGKDKLSVMGIGGVITVPNHQGQGLAQKVLAHVRELLGTLNVNFAMLFCLDHLVRFYEGQGWSLLTEEVEVLHSSGYVRSPLNAMVFEITGKSWPSGATIVEERIW